MEARRVEVAIVGSGFAGLGLAHRLTQAGIEDLVILERGREVGGTWAFNTYPGCQCDIPSHLYSFSFALNPEWSRTYPLQAELKDYLHRCADTFGLRDRIRLGTEVLAARWDDATGCWEIETSSGRISARVLVAAVGLFSEPRWPDIPGRSGFRGPSLHTAQWDPSIELAGKRVGVIGTGASAVQLVPAIQPEVGNLFVFQRTPPWVLPHTDRPTTRFERWLYRTLPAAQRVPRAFAYLLREFSSPGFNRSPRLLAPLELHARRHMMRQVADPDLRTRLIPDYRIGCKRILLSNKWYPALQRGNVELVTEGIDAITPGGVRTSNGEEIELDAIIYATGFEVTDMPFAGRVVGREGVPLDEVWRGSPLMHRNASIPGFPNLFFTLGLQTGYSSTVFMLEAQFEYVTGALEEMRAKGLGTIAVTTASFEDWNASMQGRMLSTVWNSGGCASWYLDRNGLNTTVWPDFTWKFRRNTRRFDLDAYRSTP